MVDLMMMIIILRSINSEKSFQPYYRKKKCSHRTHTLDITVRDISASSVSITPSNLLVSALGAAQVMYGDILVP